jgi:predicted regulator of Ras-like GTPase activity (Roadblock/LC7/MglB family)
MNQLEQALTGLKNHAGVEHVLLLGHDGLLVQHLGDPACEAETVAAMVPGIASACTGLGRAGERGGFRTAVVEFDAGVGIVLSLSADLLLVLLMRPNVGFAPLLLELRQQREHLAELL